MSIHRLRNQSSDGVAAAAAAVVPQRVYCRRCEASAVRKRERQVPRALALETLYQPRNALARDRLALAGIDATHRNSPGFPRSAEGQSCNAHCVRVNGGTDTASASLGVVSLLRTHCGCERKFSARLSFTENSKIFF